MMVACRAYGLRPIDGPFGDFSDPDGYIITFAEIDRDTGKLSTPQCPRLTNEAFLSGTEPTQVCELHSSSQ